MTTPRPNKLSLPSPPWKARLSVVNWALSHINKRFEREAISREVASIVSTAFVKEYRLERVPRIVIEWGEVEDVLLDLKKNMLFIVLKGGRANRHENIAITHNGN